MKRLTKEKLIILIIAAAVVLLGIYAAISSTKHFAISTDDGKVTKSASPGVTEYFISAAGTYTLKGEAKNTTVTVEAGLSDVVLILDGMYIDNSPLSTGDPVIALEEGTSASITLIGSSSVTGGSGISADALICQEKNGSIEFSGEGSLALTCKADSVDGIRSKGSMSISDGSFDIDVYGDGIQAETLDIRGGDIDIITHFANAGLNYYNRDLESTGLGACNTLSVIEDDLIKTKTEVINVDTGSHSGIKAGSKAASYSYETDADGTVTTEEASGGLTVSGGTIRVDTTDTGIKYNFSTDSSLTGYSVTAGSGNSTTVDGKFILGAPEDGIKSSNYCIISGGDITVASSDDGISAAGSLEITGNAKIDITMAYEGIEAPAIIVGSGSDSPSVSVYSSDDGINAAGKDSVTYVYADESEEQYTKTTVSSLTGYDMTVNSGSVTVTIGDDVPSHSYALPVENGYGIVDDGSAVTGTYTSNGDGIDCNGSFYARGGKTTVWGVNDEYNSPIDTADDGAYEISQGAVVLATALSISMPNDPTVLDQCAVIYSGTEFPAGNISIKKGSDTVASYDAPKGFSYLMYSSGELSDGASYTLTGGSVSAAAAASKNISRSGS